MSKTSLEKAALGKAALAVSVFACATMLSFDRTEQKGASLSIERAQAQLADPYAPGVARRQARRAAAGAAAVGAGVAAAGATAAYYGGGGPYAYYGGPGAWSQDYAARNGIICQPGTMVRLEDGLMHRCQ
jgi:ferric-dicitrate binding protein FerR (iron transport regulator)